MLTQKSFISHQKGSTIALQKALRILDRGFGAVKILMHTHSIIASSSAWGFAILIRSPADDCSRIQRVLATIGPSLGKLRGYMMQALTPVVFVVDSDSDVLQLVKTLVGDSGWQAETFASAYQFLAHPKPAVPCCVILDSHLPDLSGLEVQARLAVEHSDMPIIFLTSHPDVPTTVTAFKRGALELLIKPFDPQSLLAAVRYAVRRNGQAQARRLELLTLRANFDSLTRREQEVMRLVVFGLLNKQVGVELGISEITVKAHRGSVMRKMQADSLPHLVTMASKLRIGRRLPDAEPRHSAVEPSIQRTFAPVPECAAHLT